MAKAEAPTKHNQNLRNELGMEWRRHWHHHPNPYISYSVCQSGGATMA
jgi:hypothetical protein